MSRRNISFVHAMSGIGELTFILETWKVSHSTKLAFVKELKSNPVADTPNNLGTDSWKNHNEHSKTIRDSYGSLLVVGEKIQRTPVSRPQH